MAFALVTSTQGKGATSGSVNTTGASLIVLGQSYGTWAAPSDSKSNSYTQLPEYINSFSITQRMSYCLNPTVGSGHTFDPGASNINVIALVFSGTNPTFDAETGQTTGGSSIAAWTPGTITPAQNNSLLVSVGSGAGGALTVASSVANDGFSTITESANTTGGSTIAMAGAYIVQGAAASVDPLWTFDSAGFLQAAIAVFYEVAGGGGSRFLLVRN